ncbi:MAG: hypothetical protein NVS9B12_09170 [Vulcanimicrobiaceae bacterium]
MQMKSIVATLVIGIGLCMPAAAQTTFPGSQLAKFANVTLAQARMTALKTVHGTIVGQELEREAHGLRYSFDIKVGNKTYEVGVDAKTGKVIQNSIEGKNPD